MAGFLFIGLAVTVGSIAGIVGLARRLQGRQGAEWAFIVLGIVLLSLFALGGIAAMGCAAVMSGSHF